MASHTRDLFEYLAGLHAAGGLDTRFPHAPAKIAYQLPCHLKAQNMGTKSADLLRLTGATVETIERCSAVDGTWGMKKEYFELSMKLAAPLFKDVREAGATPWPRTARSPRFRSSRGRRGGPASRSASSPRPTGSKRSHHHDPRQDRAGGRPELLRVREGPRRPCASG